MIKDLSVVFFDMSSNLHLLKIMYSACIAYLPVTVLIIYIV